MSDDEAEAERQAAYERAAAERRANPESTLRKAQRRAVDALELPAKDVAKLRAGQVYETPALAALASAPTLTVLSGAPGSGKTTAASAWLYRFIIDPDNWDVGDDIATMRGSAMWLTAASMPRYPRYDVRAMDRLLGCTRLAIDDMGAEYIDEKGAFMALLDETINGRYADGRPTVMTTNLDLPAFRMRYGARIAGRLEEVGKFIGVGSKNLRRERPTPPSGHVTTNQGDER